MGVLRNFIGQRDLVYGLFEALVHPNTLVTVVRYAGSDSDFRHLARVLGTFVSERAPPARDGFSSSHPNAAVRYGLTAPHDKTALWISFCGENGLESFLHMGQVLFKKHDGLIFLLPFNGLQ
jgi:hypothetical protein